MTETTIAEVTGRRVWDSRGRPTVEAEVRLAGIADRFLHHAEIITITGKSYRLRHRSTVPKPTKAPTGSKVEEDQQNEANLNKKA